MNLTSISSRDYSCKCSATLCRFDQTPIMCRCNAAGKARTRDILANRNGSNNGALRVSYGGGPEANDAAVSVSALKNSVFGNHHLSC
jgi:hypothetical protein